MKHIFFLFCFVFLAEIATDIYVPILPMFTYLFDSSLNVIQLTMSLHLLGFALGQLFFGSFSDVYGRRKTLLIGLTIFIIATMLCAFSTSIEMLILFRFIQGFGACVAPVMGMSVIKDLYPDTTKNIKILSAMSMTVSLSPIIGPILGTVVAEYLGWKGCFYLLSLAGMVLFPLLYRYLNETKNHRSTAEITVKSGFVRFACLILINALIVSCVWVFITAAPFILMDNFEVPLLEYGYYQAMTVVAYIAGGLFTNRFIEKMGIGKILPLGLTLFTLGNCGLLCEWYFFGLSKWGFVGFVAFMECGIGIFRPALISRVMDLYPDKTGASAGILGTTEMFVSALAIGSLGLFNQGIIEATMVLFAFVTLLILLIYLIYQNRFLNWFGYIQPEDPVRIPANR